MRCTYGLETLSLIQSAVECPGPVSTCAVGNKSGGSVHSADAGEVPCHCALVEIGVSTGRLAMEVEMLP
jgi:hypothetical protein